MYETDLLFDQKEIAPANEFIITTLREKGRVTVAELYEHYGARTIQFVNYRLASGMDFFVPCEVQTGQPVFDGKYVRLVGVVRKDIGVVYVDFKDDSLKVAIPNWEDATNHWSPLIEHDPQQILGKTANGGFSVTGVYRRQGYWTELERQSGFPVMFNTPPAQVYLPGKISCRLRRRMKIGESESEEVNVIYEVTILEDTPPGRIHRLDLVIQDNLRGGGEYVHYSIFAEWNNETKRYIAQGTVQFDSGLSIDIQEGGHYSGEFKSTRAQTDVYDLNRLYGVLGDPSKQIDFAATIQNAFDAASTNCMGKLVSTGYLVGR